jgi:L-fucose mutarotase
MNKTPGDNADTSIWDAYRALVEKHQPGTKVGFLERFDFYDRANKAYAVIATGETAVYANVILKKGVVK